MSCPSPGAKIEICVDNQTDATTDVYVAGNAIGDQITCTGPAPILGAYQKTFTAPAGQTTCFEDGGTNPPLPETYGLLSGMYVHRIYYPPPPAFTPGAAPTPRAAQYQKGPVVFDAAAGGAPPRKWARIDWVIHKTILTVNATGDSTCNDTSCLPGACTLRQSINKARQGATGRPVLINFDLPSPSTIGMSATGSGCGTLRLDQPPDSGSAASLTIDGTDKNGRPWIVGDRSAKEANMQDTFPIRIDLQNLTRFQVTKSGHTLKGLDIANTVASGQVQANDLFLFNLSPASTVGMNEIHSVRVDGGNTLDCSGGGAACASNADLVNVSNSRTVVVRNTEGRSALDKGVKAFNTLAAAEVIDSWFHHNYRGNVQSSGTAGLTVADSVVELAGRRASDSLAVNSEANGSVANAARLSSSRSVFERNRGFGLTIRDANPVGTFDRDIACGNGLSGLSIEPSSTGPQLTASRLGTVFNRERGVRLAIAPTNLASFGESNAFVNNDIAASGKCDFDLTGGSVTVDNSQWTNGVPRKCGTGTVTTNTIQDQVAVPIPDNLTTDPTNALLKGQTVRIVGAGFNAVAGNALQGGCVIGDDPGTNSCCKKGPRLSNVCTVDGGPPAGGGQCVRIQDPLSVWYPMTVDALNPTMIVTSIPQVSDAGTIFPCTGGVGNGGDAVMQVVKRGPGGVPNEGRARYCSNQGSIEF